MIIMLISSAGAWAELGKNSFRLKFLGLFFMCYLRYQKWGYDNSQYFTISIQIRTGIDCKRVGLGYWLNEFSKQNEKHYGLN